MTATVTQEGYLVDGLRACSSALPHRFLDRCKASFQSPSEDLDITEALSYLWHMGASQYRTRHGQRVSGECLRYLLYAFYTLSEAPHWFTLAHKTMLWEAIGGIAVNALRDLRLPRSEVSTLLSCFSDHFAKDNIPWQVRNAVIDGFEPIVAQQNVSYRNNSFWQVLDYFRAYCEAGVEPTRGCVPEAVSLCVRSLVRLWTSMAENDGWSQDVQLKVAVNALPLFELILATGDLSVFNQAFWDTLDLWRRMVDGIVPTNARESRTSKEREMLQSHFDVIAERIKSAKPVYATHRCNALWEEFSGAMVPLLHGRKRYGDRRSPGPQARCRISIAGQRATAFIRDICARSSRGFQIVLPDIEVPNTYDDRSPSCGKVDDVYDRRRVDVLFRSPAGSLSRYSVEEVELRLDDMCPSVDAGLTCKVLRTWQLPDGTGVVGSGWALLAENSQPIPPIWFQYVAALPIMRA